MKRKFADNHQYFMSLRFRDVTLIDYVLHSYLVLHNRELTEDAKDSFERIFDHVEHIKAQRNIDLSRDRLLELSRNKKYVPLTVWLNTEVDSDDNLIF